MMDETPAKYAARSEEDVLRLVRENPLAWIVSADGPFATPLPLRPHLDNAGKIVGLLGHFARSNRHWDRLRDSPRGLALFMGPHAYVSPSWMADRSQAPTWNYASVAFELRFDFFDDPGELRALLADVVEAMEAGRPAAWSLAEVGDRYAALSRRIVGFYGVVVDRKATFKLAQDERIDTFAEITNGLAAEGRVDLLGWMEAFDPR